MSVRRHLAATEPLLEALGSQPQALDLARALVRELLAAHRDGMERLLALASEGPHGAERLRRLCADPDAAALLLLHGLHPEPLAQRARAAVERLAARLAARHATLALRTVDEHGAVTLTLEHPGPRGALAGEIEEGLAAAADATAVHIEEHVVAPLTFAPGRKAAP